MRRAINGFIVLQETGKQALSRFPMLTIFLFSFLLLLSSRLISLYTLHTAAMLKGTTYTSLFLYFSQSMFITGPTLFPVLHGNLYPDYLATIPFLSYLTSLPFGRATLLTVSLPYLIAGALTVAFTYRIGALHAKKWGISSALCLLLCWKFYSAINNYALDIFPALFTTIAFYLVHSAAYLDINEQRIEPPTTPKKTPLWWGYHQPNRRLGWLPILFLLGFLARGPIGLLIPMAVTVSYYFISLRFKKGMVIILIGLPLFVVASFVMLWLAYRVGGSTFLHTVMMQQGLARVYHNHQPRFYFYVTNGLLNYAITALLTIIVLVMKRQTLFSIQCLAAEQALLRQLTICWFILIILGLTLVNSKKARYILSIAPALALIAGYLFVHETQRFQRIKKIIEACFRWFPLPVLLLVSLLSITYHISSWPSHFDYIAQLPTLLFCLIMLIINQFLPHTTPKMRVPPLMISTILFLIGVSGLFIEPATFHPTGEQKLAITVAHQLNTKATVHTP